MGVFERWMGSGDPDIRISESTIGAVDWRSAIGGQESNMAKETDTKTELLILKDQLLVVLVVEPLLIHNLEL